MNVILLTDALRDAALTGIGRYVLELARGLPSHPELGSVRFFAGRNWIADPCRPFASGPAAATHSQPGCLQRIRGILPWRTMQDRISFGVKKAAFRLRTRNAATSLLHGPNYLLTPHDGPAIATIHDLSFIHYPEYHPRERLALLDRELPKTLRRAAHILTDTEFVRGEIIQILGVAETRVSVTHLGVDPEFHPRTPDQTRDVLRELGLTHGAYLLCVATQEPRKNLARLATAYSRLPAKLKTAFPLILAGTGGWLTQSLESLIQPLEQAGSARRLGYVPESRLPALFAGAAGLALPSFYEGFGLPVLEAMACGVPVLTSDRASLPEVAGNAALLVNPEDEEEILQGLRQLLTDEDFRRLAAERGPRQAAKFTWPGCIDKTVQCYRHVCGTFMESTSNPGSGAP
ncbi:glycosyltransferase family 4 protein [Desulfonatronum parangueonense]